MPTYFDGLDGHFLNACPIEGTTFPYHVYELPVEAERGRKTAAYYAAGCLSVSDQSVREPVADYLLGEGADIATPREWAERTDQVMVDGITDLLAHEEVCPLCATVYAASRGLLSGLEPIQEGTVRGEATILYLASQTAIIRPTLDFDTAHRYANRHGAKFPLVGKAPNNAEEYGAIRTPPPEERGVGEAPTNSRHTFVESDEEDEEDEDTVTKDDVLDTTDSTHSGPDLGDLFK